jgi:lipoprotein-anchoring transpeptidase ErfK/SrfK
MQGGKSAGLPYDVNGVPWVTYFTDTGAAVHGAHWHNNFGIPRSHGCINVTPDAAKWVYRWSQPYRGYENEYSWTEPDEFATVIEVIG